MLEIALNTLAQRVIALRKRKTWTQKEMARANGKLSHQEISKVERDDTDPQLSTLREIARTLEVRVAFLIGEEDLGYPLEQAISRQALRILEGETDVAEDVRGILWDIAEEGAGPTTPAGWANLIKYVTPIRPTGNVVQIKKRSR